MMKVHSLIRMGFCGLCVIGSASIGYAELTEAAAETDQAVTATAEAVTDAANSAEQKIEQAEQAIDQAQENLDQAGQVLDLGQQEVEQAAEQPTQETQAQIAQCMQLAAPSEHHAKLDALVGTWDVTASFWMTPDMPAQTSSGASEIKAVLGGRFIQENFAGSIQMPGMESQPYQGMGLIGYDNAKSQYVATWADNMSTALITSAGQFDDTTQTLTLLSQFVCPMDGPCGMRVTYTITGTDSMTMQGFKTLEGKDEVKVMEVIYTRRP